MSAPARGVAAPSAWPDHFTEPSGHQASGQLCNGYACCPSCSKKPLPAGTAPCGQGAPQVTPLSARGGCPSSQRNCTAWGVAAAPARPGAAAVADFHSGSARVSKVLSRKKCRRE